MSTRNQQLEQRFRGIRRNYPSAPAVPGDDSPEAFRKQLLFLQEQLDIIIGRRGNVLDQHVAVRDLIEQNILQMGTDVDAEVDPVQGLEVISADIAGTGNVEDDFNATDFTGHPNANGTALVIEPYNLLIIGHQNVAYIWIGPTGVEVGVGGNYTAVNSDFQPLGTADHALLTNRDAMDQHPQSAITNLVADQATQDSRLTTLEQHPPRTDNPHQVTHAQLSDKGTNDHAAIDSHIANINNPHQVQHNQLSDKGVNTHVQIDAHIADVTNNPHQVTHAQLPDKGVNTHAQIDAHIADVTTNPHQVSWDNLVGRPCASVPCIFVGLTDPVDQGETPKIGDFWIICDDA